MPRNFVEECQDVSPDEKSARTNKKGVSQNAKINIALSEQLQIKEANSH
jgi:hypothetical protein